MKEHGIKAAVFEDSEDRRESALRYLTGHPTDALLLRAVFRALCDPTRASTIRL